jgi:hypothetical protein
MNAIIQELAEVSDQELLYWPDHENAILGTVEVDGLIRVVYSRDQIVANLCREMTEEEAREYIDYNFHTGGSGNPPLLLDEI